MRPFDCIYRLAMTDTAWRDGVAFAVWPSTNGVSTGGYTGAVVCVWDSLLNAPVLVPYVTQLFGAQDPDGSTIPMTVAPEPLSPPDDALPDPLTPAPAPVVG